jgi:hypothetical protein
MGGLSGTGQHSKLITSVKFGEGNIIGLIQSP